MIDKLKEMLFDSEQHSLQFRLFILASTMGVVALILGLIITFLTAEGLLVVGALAAGIIVVLADVFFVYKTGKVQLGASIIITLVNCLLIPVGYLMGGGVFSGSPMWFVLGFLFVALILRGKPFVFFTILTTTAFGIATYLGYAHPELVIPLKEETTIYFDSFFATMVVSTLAMGFLKYQNAVFERENALALRQKEEIETLNESQNRFFSSMSHEIRTPLNTIIGLNEMILREPSISEEITENAINIQGASKMLLSLINDILDLSKIESGRMTIVPSQYETSHMLSDIVNLLWGQARDKGLRFEVSVGEDIPSMLYGDEMRVKQVIINVLNNAIKYTNEGTVTLSVDGEVVGTDQFLLIVDVHDTGVGIRKDAIPYLFDAFRRVDDERNKNVEGTGLGLAICKQLVDLMNGTITVDSIYTKGSHFRIEIPQAIVNSVALDSQRILEVSRGSSYESIFEAPEAHVLIVDDNEMNRMVSAKLLRSTLVQVDLAGSGRECLEKTLDNHYDVIFMDHEMPEMNGIETLKELRQQSGGLNRQTPVIALTANAGSDMNSFYLGHGFQAYLAKPIHGSLLEATLVRFLPEELIETATIRQEDEHFVPTLARRKRPLAITVDCPCDVPIEELEAAGIRRMPFYIITEEGRFRDIEEIDSSNLFSYIADGKKKVGSTTGTVIEYEDFFADVLTEANSVLHLSVSSSISSSYEQACKAAGSFGNVRVVDSRQLSSALGMMAIRASQLASEGKSVDEIIPEILELGERCVVTLIVPTLDSPMLAQKAPAIVRIIAHLFRVEPIFQVRRGMLTLRGFHGGYVTDALPKYVRSAMRLSRNAEDTIYVNYSGCTIDEQNVVVDLVEKHANFDNVVLQKASATISSNVGPHSFGLIWARKQ
ncbi:MAG: DegV family protein [Atopobiaceae bacterium]|nr:DegV family protein [Atopobiaceae bacterium]